jgi:tetratricopeptide (TPR) repeat protein
MMNTPSTLQPVATIDDYLAPPDVHQQRFQQLNGLPLLLIFGVVLMVGHALNVYLLFWQETPIILNILIHLILVGVAGLLVYLLAKAGLDTRLAMLMFITTAATSVMGAVGTLLCAIRSAFYVRYRHDFEEWYQSIFPRGTNSIPEQIVEDLEYGHDENPTHYSVIPFLDVFEVGNEVQKREALSRMAANFHPRFASAFKQALVDENASIRVQAATAITKIENGFHDKLLRIINVHRDFPKNPVVKKGLAEHYDNYAFTGLLDDERERVNREKAREKYLEYLQLRPDDIDVRLKVGRLLIRAERYEQAAEWFKHALDEGYATDSLKLWYMECLFKTGRFDELRTAASTFRIDAANYKEAQPEMLESLHLWSQAGANQTQERV